MAEGRKRRSAADTGPEPQQPKYECIFCDNFASRGPKPLTRHYREVHDDQRPYKCSYCLRGFSSNVNRKRHETQHLIEIALNETDEGEGVGEENCISDFD